jgi:hypothetical protein
LNYFQSNQYQSHEFFPFLSQLKQLSYGPLPIANMKSTYFSHIFQFDLNITRAYEEVCQDILFMSTLHFLPSCYFKQFSPDDNYGKIFLGNSVCKDVYKYRNSKTKVFLSPRNKPDSSDYEWFFNQLRERLEILYYDIFDILRSEVTIESDAVKRQLTTWISSTQYLSFWATHYDYDHLRGFYERYSLSSKDYNQDGNNILSIFDEYYETKLRNRSWEILKSPPGSYWLTSDNLGFIVRKKQMTIENCEPIAQHPLDQLEKNVDLYYPLSKQYCLKIYENKTITRGPWNDSVIRFIESTFEEFRRVNRFTFLTHSHFVIAGDKTAFEELQIKE